VTGFDGAEHKDFESLEDARRSMRQKGFKEFGEILKCAADDLTTLPCRGIYYYAVANGRTIGIFRDWR
jgi:viroplasmin and RNaseH domain-containing protein